MAKKHFIKNAVANKGALHRHLGVKEGETIPEEKLHSALKSKDSKIRKEANLAMTLKGLHHGAEKDKKKTHTEVMSKMYGKKGK